MENIWFTWSQQFLVLDFFFISDAFLNYYAHMWTYRMINQLILT